MSAPDTELVVRDVVVRAVVVPFRRPLATKVGHFDLDGHARIARGIATPVMLGENFYGPRAMHEAIRAQACDLVMPDLIAAAGGG